MGVVAEKRIRCGCGTVLENVLITVTWQGLDGTIYTISGVPSLQCKLVGCEEVYYSSKVEFNLSLIAEEMEQGYLSTTVEYHEKF